MRTSMLTIMTLIVCLHGQPDTAHAQKQNRKKPQATAFKWVNTVELDIPGLQHRTFDSKLVNQPVGYYILLPPGYESSSKRFPVVYYLHGGRPGSEAKSVRLASTMRKHMDAGKVPGMIYVFVNGGPVSHYNVPKREGAIGKDVFITELIPHIDQAWRTIASRQGRGIEGFSQGGRGTARIMFRHPELFSSAAPGGGGYATEKRISEENGMENPQLIFAPGDNTWDLAKAYKHGTHPPLRIQFHVGTKGFNYENNLAYMSYLKGLGIPFDRVIVEGAKHSAKEIYEAKGLSIMRFHAKSFGLMESDE